MVVKDTIVGSLAGTKVTAVTSLGISAPYWVEWLEVVVNPVLATLTVLLTGGWMLTRFINGTYEWRDNWNKRKSDEDKK